MSKFRTLLYAAALAIALAPATAHAASTGGAATPYLGWSSWSTFRCDDERTGYVSVNGGFPGPRTYSPDLDRITVATSG
jgi:hypothetical protein